MASSRVELIQVLLELQGARVKGCNAGCAKGTLNINQTVGLPTRFKINWKKVLRCEAKVFVIVAKALVNPNPIAVLKGSKVPNLKRQQ